MALETLKTLIYDKGSNDDSVYNLARTHDDCILLA